MTSIVVRTGKKTGGRGVFLNAPKHLSKIELQFWIEAQQNKVYRFPRWPDVLASLGFENLPPMPLPSPPADLGKPGRRGNGEGPLHVKLKHFISEHPKCIGLLDTKIEPKTEFRFSSADRADVLFDCAVERVAIEVKTSECDEDELTRGIFQVVKYDALLRAEIRVLGQAKSGRALLATGGLLPARLREMAERLEVEVVQDLEVRMADSC